MSQKALISMFPGLLLTFSLSCGKTKSDNAEVSESCSSKQMILLGDQCVPRNGDTGTQYQTYIDRHAPFIQSLSKDVIEVCILAQSDDRFLRDKLEKGITNAFFSWMEPLEFIADKLPQSLKFHFHLLASNQISRDLPAQDFCPLDTDLTIVNLDTLKQIKDEDRPFVAEDKIWLSNSQNADYIILHEFGHIMGLSDTYIEGESGCRKGFPDSVMCRAHNWVSLQPNDWVGAQRSYCLQTDGAHPNCFNHEKKELLSFLPTHHKINEFSSHEPYLFCSNKRFNLSFLAFGFYVEQSQVDNFLTGNQFGLLSTDSRSVSESYSENGFEYSFILDDKTLKDFVNRKEKPAVKLKMEGSSLKANFPYKGEWLDEIFTDCAFDERTAEYLTGKNIDVGRSFSSNQDYVRLLKRSRSTESRFHNSPSSIVTTIKSKNNLELESISVYAGENHNLLTKKPFEEIAKITESNDTGITIEIDMSQVPPSPEYLELFVEGQGTTLVHMKLKKNPSALIN